MSKPEKPKEKLCEALNAFTTCEDCPSDEDMTTNEATTDKEIVNNEINPDPFERLFKELSAIRAENRDNSNKINDDLDAIRSEMSALVENRKK